MVDCMADKKVTIKHQLEPKSKEPKLVPLEEAEGTSNSKKTRKGGKAAELLLVLDPRHVIPLKGSYAL